MKKIKEFFRLTKGKVILTILLLFILIFLRFYPVYTPGCVRGSYCHNEHTFHSLFGVIKNGFDWSPRIIDDGNIHYIADPFFLILYPLYMILTYMIAHFIIFLYKIRFLIISKSRIVILLLGLLSFSPMLTRLWGYSRPGGFIHNLGEITGGILLPFLLINVFFISIADITLKTFDFGSYPFSELSISLNVSQGYLGGNSLILGFIIVIILWYLTACLIMFIYDKIKNNLKKK